jgi:hypothetical protein
MLLLSFLCSLDIPYSTYFDCPCCKDLPAEERVLITDCKEMGMKKLHARGYSPPVADNLEVAEAL